jgi:hypothetical protein
MQIFCVIIRQTSKNIFPPTQALTQKNIFPSTHRINKKNITFARLYTK